ncbi:MAG: response regulator [Candidatus Riflebacteria bacterium]|nr:response regulator [Candidatus Riflebacteria bacterium]
MEKNKKIIIVEDEAIIALQIEKTLLKAGHSVLATYPSGEKTLAALETSQPDLILMDIRLQGKMDGIEAADRIRKLYDIPIVFLTAHSEGSTIESAMITEPYGYLLKPIDEIELQIALQIALYKSIIDREKAQITKELQKALEKIKILSGIIPICASCKKIRNDKGYWEQIEVYIRDHSEAEFSHGLCEECRDRLYPEFKTL